MKMHSYISVNGYLQGVAKDSKLTLKRLESATDRVGGWDKAIVAAKTRRSELDAATQRMESGNTTPDDSMVSDGIVRSDIDVSAASVLRQRLLSTATNEGPSSRDISRSGSPVPELPTVATHILVDHPDEEVSKLAHEYSELEYELTSTGPEHVKWPGNISWKKFAVYQLIPTLVYELEFPRTEK